MISNATDQAWAARCKAVADIHRMHSECDKIEGAHPEYLNQPDTFPGPPVNAYRASERILCTAYDDFTNACEAVLACGIATATDAARMINASRFDLSEAPDIATLIAEIRAACAQPPENLS